MKGLLLLFFIAAISLYESVSGRASAPNVVAVDGKADRRADWHSASSERMPKDCRNPVDARYRSDASCDGESIFDKLSPMTIMISLDGFRPEYFCRHLTPRLVALMKEGFFTETTPQFPSYTFPNHYCLVTGRSPDHHGIVNNDFYDPKFEEFFSYTNATSLLMPKWWLAEPVWNTVQEYGYKSGVVFWPGSEVAIGNCTYKKPTYTVKFNSSWSAIQRIDQLLTWIDYDKADRPSFLGCYINQVDTIGHEYGTHGDEITAAIEQVDRSIGYLVDQLKLRGIYENVNIVIVSDHGMVDTSPPHYIYLEDAGVELENCFSFDLGAIAFIRPKYESNMTNIYDALQAYAVKHGHFRVSYKWDLNKNLHYGKSIRVSPIVIISETGYLFTTKHNDWAPLGLHGYVPQDPQMHSILIYKGPALSDRAKYLKETVYSNLDVYPFVCQLLGFNGLKNDGSNILVKKLIKRDYLNAPSKHVCFDDVLSIKNSLKDTEHDRPVEDDNEWAPLEILVNPALNKKLQVVPT